MFRRRRSGQKYGAKATIVDGIRFASKREAHRYGQLKILERCKAIDALELQPVYPIIVADIRIGEYRGDFRYIDLTSGEVVLEDAKGMRTPVYKLKKRLVEALFPIQIREV